MGALRLGQVGSVAWGRCCPLLITALISAVKIPGCFLLIQTGLNGIGQPGPDFYFTVTPTWVTSFLCIFSAEKMKIRRLHARVWRGWAKSRCLITKAFILQQVLFARPLEVTQSTRSEGALPSASDSAGHSSLWMVLAFQNWATLRDVRVGWGSPTHWAHCHPHYVSSLLERNNGP